MSSTPAPEHNDHGLFQTERQREILASTIEQGRVEVSELATRFGVTTETIRRDLSELQERRLLRRVHGGAVGWETSEFEPRLTIRNDQHDQEKRRIAKLAVNELPDTGAIIIDSGSTLARFAEVVPKGLNLQIITNSLPIAMTLAERDALEVVAIGGRVRKNTMAMVDADAVASIEPLFVDTLFISSDGLTAEVGLTTPYRQEARLKQAMLRSARRVVALVDPSKFGRNQLVRFAEWSDVDVLITTVEADDKTLEQIEALGTTVLQA